jgi:hypothetical protein
MGKSMNHELLQMVNYEQVFSPQVIEKIQELFDIDVSTEECLEFIDKFGEDDFLQYYDDYIDFDNELGKYVNIETLIDFYSGLSFLDLDFYGKYTSQVDFIEKHYELDLPPVIIIDWQQTTSYVSKLFDFVPCGDGYYVFRK